MTCRDCEDADYCRMVLERLMLHMRVSDPAALVVAVIGMAAEVAVLRGKVAELLLLMPGSQGHD